MNDVFRPYLHKVLVFFDDILVYSTSVAQHMDYVRQVLQTIKEHRLYANRKKCSFGQTSVAYLGLVISKHRAAVDPEKIATMLRWAEAANIRELQGFLGLTGYYRKFIKGYATVAGPLTELLKKGEFCWTREASVAFEKLKRAMTTTPILTMPDFTQPFIVETDASGFGVGAMLLQLSSGGFL